MQGVHCAAMTSAYLMVDEMMSLLRKHHKEMSTAASSSRSISSIFKRNKAAAAIEAEALWSMFVAKHNLAFLTSDHANKLFPKMFPDSEIAKQFFCGRTKQQ